MRYLFVLIITIVSATSLCGQVIPQEGSKLNYLLTGLLVPSESFAKTYRFEIAEGYHISPEEFSDQKIIMENTKENAIITRLPRFGQSYTWRVIYLDNKSRIVKTSPFYHFETDMITLVDTTKYRLRIIDSAIDYKGMFVILDSRVMYDMAGNPVWYLPNIPGVLDNITLTRDLKTTPFGTFTFIKDNTAYEVDYNGKILWQAPQAAVRPDSQANYHHDFTRLSNGHYMISELEDVEVTDSTGDKQKLKWGSLVEFDPSKKIIWYWRSSRYFLTAEKYRQPKGQYRVNTHPNAFYFDEKKNAVYVSFRNISTILKISYPSGDVIADYDGIKDSLFKAQHHCRINRKGYLYLFNNNVDREKGGQVQQASSIVILKFRKNGTLKKIWEYTCDIDSQAAHSSNGGGSVYELDKGAILSSMGQTPRIFIVSDDKKILWNAVAEWQRNATWIPYPQYRTAFIRNSEDLKKFIFRHPNSR